MNVLDIILAILLVVGAVNGFRKGIISQLCGLAGVLLGVWLGFKFGDRLGVWLGVEIGEVASFVIIFIGAVLLAALWGLRIRRDEAHLSKEQTCAVNGFFVLLVFLRHTVDYIPLGP